MIARSQVATESDEQRRVAIRELAQRIYTAGFAEAQGTNRDWANVSIQAAEDFFAAWGARK